MPPITRSQSKSTKDEYFFNSTTSNLKLIPPVTAKRIISIPTSSQSQDRKHRYIFKMALSPKFFKSIMPSRSQSKANIILAKRAKMSTVKILDLNEDCILNIFKYLSPLDMCAVKDTCRQLRSSADQHMGSLLKEFKLCDVSHETITNGRRNFVSQLKLFLKFCGVIRILHISFLYSDCYDQIVFSTIRKCNPKLNTLTLTAVNFRLAAAQLNKTFQSLTKIRLEYLNNFEYDIRAEEVFRDIFKKCRNVKEICFGAANSAMGSQHHGIFLQHKYEHLRSLELYDIREIDIKNLNLALKLNTNLERITLKQCITVQALSEININNSPQISGISVQFGRLDTRLYQCHMLTEVDELCKLRNLKYLAFDCSGMAITHFIRCMSQTNSLNYLALSNVFYKINADLADALKNMTNLTHLRLQISVHLFMDFQDFCKVLSVNLVKLRELYLFGSFNIEFQDICEFIDNSMNLQKLYLPNYMGDIYNEGNYLALVHRRSKYDSCQINIFIDYKIFPIAMAMIPKELLNAYNHVVKFSEFKPSCDDYRLIPDSI